MPLRMQWHVCCDAIQRKGVVENIFYDSTPTMLMHARVLSMR
jgi:hypothetical protein